MDKNRCIYENNNKQCSFKCKNINKINLYCLKHYKQKYNNRIGGDIQDRENYFKFIIDKYNEILDDNFKQNYKIIKHIARTSYCDIILINELSTNKEYIMKLGFMEHKSSKIKKEDKDFMNFMLKKIEYEYNILKQLNHPNIIKLKTSTGETLHSNNFYKRKTKKDILVYFITEKYEETLESKFRRLNQNIPLDKIKQIGIDLINTVQYIHQQNYVYIDFSLNNIMFKSKDSYDLVLIDFGMAEIVEINGKLRQFQKGNNMYGTLSYSSKNATIGNTSDKVDDIESITYILLFLVLKFLPWDKFIVNYTEQAIKDTYHAKSVLYKSKYIKQLPDFMKKLIYHLENYQYFNETPQYNDIIEILSE
jgi:serine/threonine protein kinase